MCFVYRAVLSISFLIPNFLFGAATIALPDTTVGNGLEVSGKIQLDDPAPDEGLQVTLRSGDPKLLQISSAPDKPGAASTVIKVRAGNWQGEFWLQGRANSGTVTYTAEAPGRLTGTGTVTLSPSGIVIWGPFRAAKFPTTTGGLPSKITFIAARLDSYRQFAEQQSVAADLRLEVSNSNPAAGRLADSQAIIPAGDATFITEFHPSAAGETTFSVKPPSGFSMPGGDWTTVTAMVKKPGLYITDDAFVGQNLEIDGAVVLGELAPAAGVTVTITSSDPSRLLLSNSMSEVGAATIQVKVGGDQINAQFYLQALAGSGEVEYSATAPGFRSRTSVVNFAPSGITLTPAAQGPPDEGRVLKKATSEGNYGFTVKESAHTMELIAWTAMLIPATHRSADITIQALRPGMSVTVPLVNSNPAVGKTASEIKIPGGWNHGTADFTPLSVGTTEISVVTPKNFTPSANSTKVLGTVVH
jgi:hypothetical protein